MDTKQVSRYTSRPAKKIICARCGVAFYHKKLGGKPKYCLECGLIVSDLRQRVVAKKWREKHPDIVKDYNKRYYARRKKPNI